MVDLYGVCGCKRVGITWFLCHTHQDEMATEVADILRESDDQ